MKQSAIAANKKREGFAAPAVLSEQWSYVAGAGHALLQLRWARISCRLWHCLVALPKGSFFE